MRIGNVRIEIVSNVTLSILICLVSVLHVKYILCDYHKK